MIKLVAALQLESEVNQQIIHRVLKRRPQHRSMTLGEKICLMSAAYYPFAAWNLTTYLDHTRSHYSHAAAVPFSPTVQARHTTSPNFIKLQSNASSGNSAPVGCAWKKHQQQQEHQTLRHCTAEDKNQTSRQGKYNETKPSKAWDLSWEERAEYCSTQQLQLLLNINSVMVRAPSMPLSFT